MKSRAQRVRNRSKNVRNGGNGGRQHTHSFASGVPKEILERVNARVRRFGGVRSGDSGPLLDAKRVETNVKRV